MKKLLPAAIALLCMAGSAYAAPSLIAEWDFNTVTDSPLTVAPSYQLFTDATSQFSMLGSAPASSGAYSAQSTSSDGYSSDPTASHTSTTYVAYNTQGYDTAGDKAVWGHSTVGFQNIIAESDYRRSGTCPIDFQWVYSTDGGQTWNGWNSITLVNDTKWHNNNSSGVLPSVSNNNPSFVVGVAVHTPGPAGGTLRFDMLQIYGDVVPEPGSLVALFTGCVGLVGFVRRLRKQ